MSEHAEPKPVDDRPAEKELAPDVAAARDAADALAAITGPALEPTLEAVLENCRIALKALAHQHARLADRSDMDLDGDTRWATRWRLAAAAIAYANALVDLTDGGYVDSALPTQRALYEAVGVLGVVNDDAEQTIFDHWLEPRGTAEEGPGAAERQAKRINKEVVEHGVELDVLDISAQMEQIYSVLRREPRPPLGAARHGQRAPAPRGLPRASRPGRTRARHRLHRLGRRGHHPGVGDALAAFYGGRYYAQIIKPIQDGLMASAAQLIALTDSLR